MPDESKATLKPGRSWFEINPTCSPVFITEGPGLIFHKPAFAWRVDNNGSNRPIALTTPGSGFACSSASFMRIYGVRF
jgi:hypothetical protein